MIGGVAVRLGGLALSYLFTILLSRLLGAEGFGTFASGLALSAMLATVAGIGLPTLATREVARLPTGVDCARLIRTILLCVSMSIAVVWLIMAVVSLTRQGEAPLGSIIALIVFPMTALIRVRQGVALPLVGMARALLPEQIALPLLAIGGTLLAASQVNLNATAAGAIYGAASVVALIVGAYSIAARSSLPDSEPRSAIGDQLRKLPAILRRGFPFLLVELPNAVVANVDILIVTMLLGPSAGGGYALATRLAAVIMVPSTAVVMSYMPQLAAAGGDSLQAEQSKLAQEASFFSLIGGIVVGIFLLTSCTVLIGALGPGFEGAMPILAMLGCLRVVTNATAPSEAVLLMSNHEHLAILTSWLRAALVILLCAAGALGGTAFLAGVGYVAAILITHATLVALAWRHCGVLTYPRISRSRFRLVLSGRYG